MELVDSKAFREKTRKDFVAVLQAENSRLTPELVSDVLALDGEPEGVNYRTLYRLLQNTDALPNILACPAIEKFVKNVITLRAGLAVIVGHWQAGCAFQKLGPAIIMFINEKVVRTLSSERLSPNEMVEKLVALHLRLYVDWRNKK